MSFQGCVFLKGIIAFLGLAYSQPPGPSYEVAPAQVLPQTLSRGPPAWAPDVPAPRKSKFPAIAVACALVSVVMAGASLVSPWYFLNIETGGTFMGVTQSVKAQTSYDLYAVSITTATNGTETKTNHTAWNDVPGMARQKEVVKTTLALTVVALVTSILMLVGAVIVLRGGKKQIGVVLAVVAVVFNGLSPVYYMTALTPAIKEDASTLLPNIGPSTQFSGTTSVGFFGIGVSIVWGPSIGWYLLIVSFILSLVCLGWSLVVLLVRKHQPANLQAGAAMPVYNYQLQQPGQVPQSYDATQAPGYAPQQPPSYPQDRPPQN